MSKPDSADQLATQLQQKIHELDELSQESANQLDAEKFRKSAFRLRTMQTESLLFELVGKQVSLRKFKHQVAAKAAISELAKFAKLKPEQQQVADFYRQLNLALLGSTLPFILSAAILMICAIWLFD